MKSIATLALATLASISATAAADLPSMKDYRHETVTTGENVNWSGFYVGVQGGYGNANHNLTVQAYRDEVRATCPVESQGCTDADGNPVEAGSEYIAANGIVQDLLNLDGLNSHGGIGGGRVGYDFATNRFVFGLFGEYNVTNMETTLSVPGLGAFGLEKDDEWSIGGRVGYIVAPRTLAYILAAYTQTEYNVTGLNIVTPGPNESLKTGAAFDGISVGGGVEFAVTNNVFFGLEYVHTFYGEENIIDYHQNGNPGGGLRVVDDLDEDKVMATLKFKLF